MKHLLYIVLLLLITLVSCNKQEERLIELTPDLLNCCYKTNSYWVYIDSVSNSSDSVYVYEYTQGIEEGAYETDYLITNSEYFIYTTQSSSRSTMFKVQSKNVEKNIDNSAIIPIYYDYDYNQPGFDHLDSIYIYDRNYYHVIKVVVEEDGTEDNNRSVYFKNSDFGILRHDIYNDTVLVSQKILMRKNIVR